MQCPHCHVPLAIAERQGIEIDYCPQCRGVWLDRGELDKIIERSAGAGRPAAAPPPAYGEPRRDGWGHGHQPYPQHHKHKRRKSFLEEVFDF